MVDSYVDLCVLIRTSIRVQSIDRLVSTTESVGGLDVSRIALYAQALCSLSREQPLSMRLTCEAS